VPKSSCRARAIDPLSPQVLNLAGFVHVRAGRLEAGVRLLEEALALSPQNDITHEFLGHAYLQQGMAQEAITAFERAAALSGTRSLAHLAYAHAVTGNRQEAERLVRELHDPAAHPYLPPFHMAVACVGLGDADEAFRWLERGCEEHASYMDSIQAMPYLAPLHADARWGELLRRMQLGS
jgi:Flp pilus assembly protein TadD